MRKRFRTWFWPLACLAFLPCGSAYGEALFLERFEYENGELSQASSGRWTPTTSDSANPNLNVVDGQLTWDFTGKVADPVNNGYYGAIFGSSGISSGSLYTYFDLEVTEAPPDLPPGKVTVYGVPGGGISVNWKDNSNNESGFRVEKRAAGDSDLVALAVVGSNRTHYLDSSSVAGIKLEYRIVALGETELISGWSEVVQRYDDPQPLTTPALKAKKEDGGLLLGFPAIPQVTYEVQESIDLENWNLFKYLQTDSADELSVVLKAGEFGRRFARIVSTQFSIPPQIIGLNEEFKMPENETGSVFRLSDFGATPGVTDDDDAIAIRSALTAMAFGDILEVEDGNYHLKTTVVVPSGVTIRAASAKEVVYYTSGISSAFKLSPNTNDVTLAGFAIVGTDEMLSYGVEVGLSNQPGPERIRLKDLRIEGFSRQGIRLRSTKHVKVENCRILNATNLGGGGFGYGVELHGSDSQNNWITGCRIGPEIRYGVLLQFSAHNNLIENNTCFETTEDAFDLHGEDEYANELRFNLAYWDGDSAEVGSPAGFGVGNTGATHDNSGPGNWIHHNEVRGYQIGVEVIQGSHVQFIDANDLKDNAVAGIKIHNGGGNSIYLRRNSVTGSEVGVQATRCAGFVVEENTIGGNVIGVMTTSDMTDYRIYNNDLRGNDRAKDLGSDAGEYVDNLDSEDPFASWNDLEPEPWWRESAPYSCYREKKETSPWLSAGLIDLGGSDSLSLIRYFGNGSYLRYGYMGFHGCTPLEKYPDAYHLDPPADPTYYSLGDLDIHVDIARVPGDATGWFADDGSRVDFSMVEEVALLNTYVATYFRRVSQDRFRITFHAGNEFDVPDDGSPTAARDQQWRLVGACLEGCTYGAPGGLNRILLNDVAADTGGNAYNGSANFGLASFRDENMETIVHEIGHGWMLWPHSFAELPWRPYAGGELHGPNPYSNFYDIMSGLDLSSILGWSYDLPSTLAINRYSAGWIDPKDVALHLEDSATYTLSKPFEEGVPVSRHPLGAPLRVYDAGSSRGANRTFQGLPGRGLRPVRAGRAAAAQVRRRAGEPLRPDGGHRHKGTIRAGALRQGQPGFPDERGLGQG